MNEPVDLASRRTTAHKVALVEMPAPPEYRVTAPFTVTISDARGKLYEATFPDITGDLLPDTPVLGTVGTGPVVINLLTGMLRVVGGAS